ncbi:MAG: hypothetical protein AAB306_02395 [Pseudomonadota bacterium]
MNSPGRFDISEIPAEFEQIDIEESRILHNLMNSKDFDLPEALAERLYTLESISEDYYRFNDNNH